MNYDYFERKMGTNAQFTSRTKGKAFVPTYPYNPEKAESQTQQTIPENLFQEMRWPQYYEIFGASSRNRT